MTVCQQCSADIERDGDRCARCGHAPGDPPDEMVGTEVLGRYRIVRLLAEGGMGRVYLATQAVGTATRQVAIKILRRQLSSDPQLATRFAREAETLVRLTHPNTVQLFDFGALADGTLALVMEHVKGHSLAEELAKGPLPLARVKRILAQIGGALNEAHTHGIVHRDLKPDNVLIAHREGQADFVKVLDFGIASVSEIDQAARTRLTQQGMMVGTPPYMSPEQFSGERVDARSDVYSLALIAYELLSGRLPFDAKTPWEWASKHMTQAPLPLTPTRDGRIGAAQVRAIHRALEKKPEQRPANVDAFLAEFAGESGADASAQASSYASASEALAVSVSGEREQPAGVRSRGRVGLAVGVVAISCIAALAAARSFWLRDARSDSARAESVAAPPPPPSPALGAAQGGMAPELPRGVAPPELPALEARQRGESRHRPSRDLAPSRPSAAAARESERARPERESAPARAEREEPTSEAPPPVAVPQPPSQQATAPAAPRGSDSPPPSPRTAAPAAARSPAPAAVPPDLEQRLARISEAVAKRPEVAVSLFQAAASRYGGHPALGPMRELLRKNGRERVAALRQQNLCPQAQALQRALASIQAASPASELFGGSCPAP